MQVSWPRHTGEIPPRKSARPESQPLQQAAADMLDLHGVPQDNHQILRNNLAFQLQQMQPQAVEDFRSQGLGPEGVGRFVVKSFADFDSPDFTRVLKIERDTKNPYSDDQVQARLETLQSGLQGEIRNYMDRNHGRFPTQMWVVGSLVKGGFGANSDVDVVFDRPPAQGILPSPKHDVHSQYLDKPEDLEWFGRNLPLDPQAVLENRQTLQQIHGQSWNLSAAQGMESAPAAAPSSDPLQIEERNIAQMELMKMMGAAQEPALMLGWIDQHAKNFGDFIDSDKAAGIRSQLRDPEARPKALASLQKLLIDPPQNG